MTFFSDMTSATVNAKPAESFHGPSGSHGVEQILKANFTMTTAESVLAEAADPVIYMFKLPWNSRLNSLRLDSSDLGGTWTTKCGIYPTTIDGDVNATATDDDVFETTLDLGTARANFDWFKGASLTDLDRGKPLWELAGLSEHPNDGTEAAICLTTLVITSAVAGSVHLTARYMANA